MWQKRKMRCGATVPVYIRTYNISVHISSISKTRRSSFHPQNFLTLEWVDGEEVKMCAYSFFALKNIQPWVANVLCAICCA